MDRLMDQTCNEIRNFSIAEVSRNGSLHYVDDYRYDPGRTLCGRMVPDETVLQPAKTESGAYRSLVGLCKICTSANYPTESEWRSLHQCTDCGVSIIGELVVGLRLSVLAAACPVIASGVRQNSCIDCIEYRLKRTLYCGDFVHPELMLGPMISERLSERVMSADYVKLEV